MSFFYPTVYLYQTRIHTQTVVIQLTDYYDVKRSTTHSYSNSINCSEHFLDVSIYKHCPGGIVLQRNCRRDRISVWCIHCAPLLEAIVTPRKTRLGVCCWSPLQSLSTRWSLQRDQRPESCQTSLICLWLVRWPARLTNKVRSVRLEGAM